MSIVIDSFQPDPAVIPYNGSVEVLVIAHQESTPDDPGTIVVRFVPADGGPAVDLATIPAVVDSPSDPAPAVPWAEIQLVPVELVGVSTVNNGGGSYTVSHTA